MMDPGAGFDSSSTANGTFGHNPWVDEDFVGATFSPGPIPDQASRSLQVDIVVCSILTLLIAITFVGLRFYVRGYVSKVLGWSDWVILPALLCSAGVTASALEQLVNGAGKHWWEFDMLKFTNFQRAAWYGMLFYNLSLSFTRISILLLYKRIFTWEWIQRTVQLFLLCVIALTVWFAISVLTVCIPLVAFWDWSLFLTTHVYCQPANVWWANAGLHLASDLIIMALPMPVLCRLTLPRRQKYAIVGVFALGFFVCIISVVRLAFLVLATQHDWQTHDGSYTSAHMIYWTTIEVNAAISCACIMTLKPLIERIFPRFFSPSTHDQPDPTLQWITPLGTHSVYELDQSNDNRLNPGKRISSSSPTSGTFPLTSPTQTHQQSSANYARRSSPPALYPVCSRAGSIGVSVLPHLSESRVSVNGDTLEKSRYYHGFTASSTAPLRKLSAGRDIGGQYDLDADLDLEAHRLFGGDDYLDEKLGGPSLSTSSTAVAGDLSTPSTLGRKGDGLRRSSSLGSRSSSEQGPHEDSTPMMGRSDGERTVLRAPPKTHLRPHAVSEPTNLTMG